MEEIVIKKENILNLGFPGDIIKMKVSKVIKDNLSLNIVNVVIDQVHIYESRNILIYYGHDKVLDLVYEFTLYSLPKDSFILGVLLVGKNDHSFPRLSRDRKKEGYNILRILDIERNDINNQSIILGCNTICFRRINPNIKCEGFNCFYNKNKNNSILVNDTVLVKTNIKDYFYEMIVVGIEFNPIDSNLGLVYYLATENQCSKEKIESICKYPSLQGSGLSYKNRSEIVKVVKRNGILLEDLPCNSCIYSNSSLCDTCSIKLTGLDKAVEGVNYKNYNDEKD